MKLTERQKELLLDLAHDHERRSELLAAGDVGRAACYREWQTPLDLGGTGASNHAHVLKALMKKGLVDRKKYCWHLWKDSAGVEVLNRECRCKGSCRYRISAAGVELAKTL